MGFWTEYQLEAIKRLQSNTGPIDRLLLRAASLATVLRRTVTGQKTVRLQRFSPTEQSPKPTLDQAAELRRAQALPRTIEPETLAPSTTLTKGYYETLDRQHDEARREQKARTDELQRKQRGRSR